MSMSVSFSENCEIKETEKQIAKTSHQFQVYNLIKYGSQPVSVWELLSNWKNII